MYLRRERITRLSAGMTNFICRQNRKQKETQANETADLVARTELSGLTMSGLTILSKSLGLSLTVLATSQLREKVTQLPWSAM